MIGVVFNTILPIIVFPYVTRVLGVDGIGKYTFYSSALTYAALFTGFGIPLYGTREIGKCANDLQKRSQKLAELMTINLIIVALSAIPIFYFAFLSSYSNDWLIILLFSFTLLTNAIGAEWFFVGIEKQGFMLIRNVLIKTLSTILIFLLVKEPKHLPIYVAITVFSMAGSSLTNIYYLVRLFDFKSVKKLKLTKYIKPLSSIFLIEVLLRFLGLGDVVILGILAGDNAVGIYSMGLKVFLLISSIMKVTATTLMPRSAFYIENNDTVGFNSLFCSTIRLLFMVGLPISVCMYLFAEPVIFLLGGEQFIGSIGLMREMSFFLLLCVLINTFVFQLLYPQNRIQSIIWAHAIGLIINLILNICLVPCMSFQGTFIAFAVSNVIIMIILYVKEKKYLKSLQIKDNVNYLYASCLAILPVLCVNIFVAQSNCLWIVMLLVYGLSYLLLLRILKDKLFLMVINKIFTKR